MPLSAGVWAKNVWSAAMPPAEPPSPTTGRVPAAPGMMSSIPPPISCSVWSGAATGTRAGLAVALAFGADAEVLAARMAGRLETTPG